MSGMTLHPPYPATTAGLGGLPTVGLDVPVCAVFMVLFMIGAASHMTIFQTNRIRGHKFVPSAMLFGFCMSRIVTMVLRIVWSIYPTNIKIAIAAQVFVYAGVVLLFVINILFAQRITRAIHPNSGWHPIFHYAFMSLWILIVFTLIALIVSVIQSFYTLNLNTKRIDRDILLYGQTFYAAISFLPIVLVVGGLIIPRKTRVEKFGSGRFRHKVVILLISATLICAGASFRAGTNFAGGERPRTNPANYQNKACFYVFNFTVEIIVIYLYVLARIDKRFHIPNNSHGPGDYSREPGTKADMKSESAMGMGTSSGEEVSDQISMEDLTRTESEKRRIPDEERGMATGGETGHGQAPAAAPIDSVTPSSPPVAQPPASHPAEGELREVSGTPAPALHQLQATAVEPTSSPTRSYHQAEGQGTEMSSVPSPVSHQFPENAIETSSSPPRTPHQPQERVIEMSRI